VTRAAEEGEKSVFEKMMDWIPRVRAQPCRMFAAAR
jgi:hypothetical protein